MFEHFKNIAFVQQHLKLTKRRFFRHCSSADQFYLSGAMLQLDM